MLCTSWWAVHLVVGTRCAPPAVHVLLELAGMAPRRTPCAPLAPAPPQDEVFLNGAIVLPHKDLKESILEPGTIIM